MAKKFNERLEGLQSNHGGNISRIEFLQPWFYEWYEADGTISAVLCEKRLDKSCYKKWNDNKGGVFGLNQDMHELVGALAKVDEGADEDEDEDEEGEPTAEEHLARMVDSLTLSRIIDEDVPQAFSHWSYVYTKGQSLVCDLQGVLTTSRFELTDPAIHSSGRSRKFGATDQGKKGQHLFFETHKCNPLCEVLHLSAKIPSRNVKLK